VREAGKSGKTRTQHSIIKAQILRAYDHIADAIEPSSGLAGERVREVKVDAIRDELRRRGFVDVDDNGNVVGASRMAPRPNSSTKTRLVEADGMIWRIRGREW
jgi:hypothetical protein